MNPWLWIAMQFGWLPDNEAETPLATKAEMDEIHGVDAQQNRRLDTVEQRLRANARLRAQIRAGQRRESPK